MLRVDRAGLVEAFLLAGAGRSSYFAYLLVCQLESEGTPPDEAFKPTVSALIQVFCPLVPGFGICLCSPP